MSFWFEGLQLLVWQRSWLHASGGALTFALLVYAILIWVTAVLTRLLLDVEFNFTWQTPMWLRHLFFWLGFFAFIAWGAALGWWLNQSPIYAANEPLMVLGAGLGAVVFQALYRSLVRWRHRPH